MNNLQLKQVPVAKTGMLIRRPVAAGRSPMCLRRSLTLTSRPSSGLRRAVAGPKSVSRSNGNGKMYDASTEVTVKAIEPNKRILIEWDGYSGRTTVEWKFAPQKDGTTFVSIMESGWTGDGDELVKYVTNSTQGFTWTLAGLKGLLEHNVRLKLVADRFPKGPEEPYPDE